MDIINRSIAIIKPKQPFVDWVNSTGANSGPKLTLEQVRCDNICVLIPEFESLKDARGYIEKIHDQLWLWEFKAWWTDEKIYPQNRSYEVFCQWFEVDFGSEVVDWAGGEITKEELRD